MSDDRYHSVPERITWTTGFRLPIDKHVLGVLSTFANFRTGKHADMYLDTLVGRARIERRRVIRSLRRLEADGWIEARRRHRRPTIYDINVDRLATHWMQAKLVEPLSDTRVTQEPGLSDTGDTQDAISLSDTGDRLSDTGDTQEAVLSDTGVTPRSPVRSDPQLDHKEPALRAASPDQTETPTPTLFADTEAKVERAKASAPQQLTFGPQDVRAPPDPNWRQRFAETIRGALRSNADRRTKHG
jgi:hypothetical protein